MTVFQINDDSDLDKAVLLAVLKGTDVNAHTVCCWQILAPLMPPTFSKLLFLAPSEMT